MFLIKQPSLVINNFLETIIETINETNNFEIIQNFISVQPLFILIFSSHILLKSPHGDEAEQIDTR